MLIIDYITINDVELNLAKSLRKDVCEKYKIIAIKKCDNLIKIVSYEKNITIPSFVKFIFKDECYIDVISRENFEELKKLIFKDNSEDIENMLIFNAIDSNASDIHFEPNEEYVNVRFRIDGELIFVDKIQKDEYLKLSSKIKLQGNMDITEKRRIQDGKVSVSYKNLKYDLRISSIPVVYGEKIVIRILYCNNFIYSLANLGFNKKKREIIKRIINSNNGLVLINGPTGCGKSTTLYTILKEVDKKGVNITTLEDPVEVHLNNINQMALNKKLGIDFVSGLRGILRQDPDIIMIGEIRDEETAKMAVSAAITGHKVYSSIHAKSPKETYLRLGNMGVKDYLIKDALIAIISQRLVRTLCDRCKKIDDKKSTDGYTVYEKKGCEFCNYSGYKGRQLISSVYLDKNNTSIMKQNEMDKNYELDIKEELFNLLNEGKISYSDYKQFIEREMIVD